MNRLGCPVARSSSAGGCLGSGPGAHGASAAGRVRTCASIDTDYELYFEVSALIIVRTTSLASEELQEGQLMAYKVLVSCRYMQPIIDRFSSLFGDEEVEFVIPPVRERLSEAELLPLVGEIDGAICGDDRFSKRVLETAPRLMVISKWGTGVDSIDVEAAKRLGIAVCNTPGSFTDQVADTVLGYVLCLARRLMEQDRITRSGRWEKLMLAALCEGTLGVIGVGRIGKAVVRRALGFGMRIVGNDIVEMHEDFLSETAIEMTSKDRLLEEADFVSLNCTLNPTSCHIVGARELALMKPTAYLINTARGPLIDEPALIEALRTGLIAGAALDVFEEEPLPQDSPLRTLENCLLAPHNANNSPDAWERVHLSTVQNLVNELRKRKG